MRWERAREGYLLIDHRASPGIPPDQARAFGIPPERAGEGKIYEQATLTCAHCRTAIVKNPYRLRPRENCAKCGNKYICDFCHGQMQHPDYVHFPLERHIDIAYGDGKQIPLGTPLDLLLKGRQDG